MLILISLNNYKSWSQNTGKTDSVNRLVGVTDSFTSGNKSKIIYLYSFTYDNQGRPVSQIYEYKNNDQILSTNKMQFKYDENDGKLLSKISDDTRYLYFYDNMGTLKRITLEIPINKKWTLCEETLLEQKELPGNKKLLLYTLNKLRTIGYRKDSIDKCSEIEYIINTDNSIMQSKLNTYNYKTFKTPKELIYSYDDKPNPLQQIFKERWYEFDLENRGLTNLLFKKWEGGEIKESRIYEYNESGYPVSCLMNGSRKQTFKYELIAVAVQKPVESLKMEDNKSSLFLYPNPARTEVTVRADGLGEGLAHVRLYDINGRVIKEVSYTVSNTLETLIPVGGISRGMYIIKIISPKATVSKKLILQ